MEYIDSNANLPEIQGNSTLTKLEHAMQLAERGLYLFPLIANDKTPLRTGWAKTATRDPEQLRKWFDNSRDYNIGIATKLSGLIGWDTDVKHHDKITGELIHGTNNFIAIAGGIEPETFTVETTTGGKHFIFSGEPVDGKIGVVAPGVDIKSKGESDYLVAPGSTIDGKSYQIVNHAPIAAAPEWSIAAIAEAYADAAKADAVKIDLAIELDTDAAIANAVVLLNAAPPAIANGTGTGTGTGNDDTYKMIAKVKDNGISEDAALDVIDLYSDWNSRCSPPWDRDELAEIISHVYRHGQNSVGSASVEIEFDDLGDEDLAGIGNSANDNRPTIRIKPGDIAATVDRAANVLRASSAPLYQRGGELVEFSISPTKAADGSDVNTPALMSVNEHRLGVLLSRAAACHNYDQRTKKWKRINPPVALTKALQSSTADHKFRTLAGVITAPTLRPDGTVLDQPGYDEATGLLLAFPPAMGPIPEHPTKQDALAALADLSALLGEFPFEGGKDSASKAVALSALITPVVRGCMDVVPMHAVNTPAPGTGKSYLVDLASAIATGDRAAVMGKGENEAELSKRVDTAMLDGLPIISFDNVNCQLGGDTLCQAVERPRVNVRLFGKKEAREVINSATIFANGNNITLTEDIVRRAIVCTLDANEERPELRRFKSNPLEAIRANRGRYIRAALIVVRAYQVASYPDPRPAMASFGRWSKNVRSALVWLGCADPVDTMKASYDDDPATVARQEVCAAWAAIIEPGTFVTTGELAEKVELAANDPANDNFYRAFAQVASANRNGHGPIDAKRLANWFQRNKSRVVGGYKISAIRDDHLKQQTWGLQKAS